jgi:hypothetical protein
MSKRRTELSKYKSPSTGDFCTPAQYVAEIICQRQAKHEKAGTLPYKFWNKGKWKSIYIRQIGLANKLIKEFGEVSGLCPLDHMVVLDNIWSD